MNSRVTLRGRWGPRRIGFLLTTVLLSVGIWRSQGPLTVAIVLLLGLVMAYVGVFLERRWLKKRSGNDVPER